jgi:hypothetical protein
MKTLSDFIIEVPYISPATSAIADEILIRLFVWSGKLFERPSLPNFTITKLNPEALTDTLEIDIAPFIDSFISTDIEIPTATGLEPINNQKWYEWDAVYTTNEPADTNLPQLSQRGLAMKGYNYRFKNTVLTPIFIEENTYFSGKESKFIIPILSDEPTPPPPPVYEIEITSVERVNSTTVNIFFTTDMDEAIRSYMTVFSGEVSPPTSTNVGVFTSPRALPLEITDTLFYFRLELFDVNGFSATSDIFEYDND